MVGMPCSLLLLQIITMTARADTGQTMNNERLFSIISPGLCFFFFFLGCNGWDLLSVVKGSSTGYYYHSMVRWIPFGQDGEDLVCQ